MERAAKKAEKAAKMDDWSRELHYKNEEIHDEHSINTKEKQSENYRQYMDSHTQVEN